ncbi:MAG: hypothetical protein GY894_00615, partial [Planctomycetes bacterium]|nr:hypothetical protein [Planctomycetota bacterium]
SGEPTVVSTETTTSFPVRIFERAEAPDPATAMLLYRGAVGDFDEAALSHLGGENYEATLPTFMCSESPEFYIAVDGVSGGSATYPGGAPNEVLTAVVASDVAMAFDDNGETDPGWTVSGSASDGHWDRGIPAGGGDRGDPPIDGDGSGACWLTDNVAGNSDVDGGDTTLTSPVLTIPDDGWQLSYWRWFSNDFGAAPNEDVMRIQWSEEGSSAWNMLEQVGPTGASGGWMYQSLDLDIIGMEGIESFRIRVIAEDGGSGSVVEAGFDGVQLAKLDCVDDNPCPADIDDDGDVDVDDILLVIGAFGTTGPVGDINEDGIVDVNDVLVVVAGFGPC